MESDRELLKPSDVAPLLGVSAARVYQLFAAGELPFVRVGGAIRVPRAAWEAWLARQRDRALEAVKSHRTD